MKRKLQMVVLIGLLVFVSANWTCKTPTWVDTAESIAGQMVPIIGSIVDIVDPAAAPIVTIIENGFTALLNVLKQYQATPTATNLQAVQAAVAAIQSNITQLEAAAQVKDPKTATEITGIINLCSQALAEIVALVPPAAGARAPTKLKGTPQLWTAANYRAAYNSIVAGDARFKQF